jgi:hypothetical protein
LTIRYFGVDEFNRLMAEVNDITTIDIVGGKNKKEVTLKDGSPAVYYFNDMVQCYFGMMVIYFME